MKINDRHRTLRLLTIVLALSAGCGSRSIIPSAAAASTAIPTSASVLPATAATSKTFPSSCISTGSSADTNYTYGSFTVSSNIWNRGAASAFTQCTSATIQSPGGVTVAEFHWNFASTNSDVKTWPNIQFGQQNSFRPSTTPLLPALISALPSLVATGTVTTTCTTDPCYYDTGFDIFFSKGANSSPLIQAELAIMPSYNFSQTLGGFAVSDVSIGGATYNIRQFTMGSGSNSWPFVAYFAVSPNPQINLNLNINSFVADAVKRGYIPSSYYLDMVEVGTEVLSGKGVTKITNYNIQ